MKEYDLHKMIDLYFEAQLSQSEEKELLEKLLSCKEKDRMADEALAVMLMARSPILRKKRKKNPRTNTKRYIWSVAATVALLVGIGGAALWNSSAHNQANAMEGMVAYVGGVRVEDREEIMEIVDNQLNDIGICSDFFAQEVSSDLDDIRQALNSEDI